MRNTALAWPCWAATVLFVVAFLINLIGWDLFLIVRNGPKELTVAASLGLSHIYVKDSMPVDKKLEFTHAEGVQFVVDQFSGSAVLILLRSGSVVLVAPAPLVRLGPLQFVVQKRLVPMRSFRFQFLGFRFFCTNIAGILSSNFGVLCCQKNEKRYKGRSLTN